jgi:hypothetical protein
LPGADDILGAMREAGAEFARMADAMESRLPAIGEALSKAPAHLKPLKDGLEEVARIAAGIGVDRLVDQLGEAGSASSALLKSMVAVQDSLDAVAGKAAGAASAYFDITAEAKKSARQVDELAARMDKFGDSLAKRNDQAEELHRRVKDAAEKFTPPRADAGGMPRRNASAAVGDESAKMVAGLVEQMLAAGKTSKEIAEMMGMFRDMSTSVVGVQHQFAKLETAVQALSGPINQARADLGKMAPEAMAAWGKSAAEAIGDMARQAEAMPDISPVDASDLRRLQTALATMDKMADKPDDMRKAMSRFRKQIEAVKNVGSAFNRELGQQIEHLSDETRRWYGLSFKDQREIAGWQAKHIRAAELNIQKGMNATYAYGAELWRAMKDSPVRALSGAVDELRKLTKGLITDLTGVGEFTYSGLAKAFIAVGDDIKKDRQELMKLTADAGLLSSMFQAGMGADELTAEYDKLRQSMNNMLGRWGKTREESVASMRALTDAGFSMSSILGPTLKETEGGLWAFARAGEYAMTGLEELAKVSVVTGKDMGEVAAMAGQWREKLGVSISEVGETYLELESAARRSGLSVGKFMDRVMSSASGFVLFGGRVDEVADSLSGLMAGMRLPPGMAADIAGDFMQRLSGMTMEEATTAVAFVGKAGTDAMLKSAQAFKDQRSKDVEQTKREMEKLDASGLQTTDADAYSRKRGELAARLEKSEEDSNQYAALLLKASQGDALATSRLLQLEGQKGHASAARLKLHAAIKTMGVKEEDLLKKGATVEEGILAEMIAMEQSGASTWLMEEKAKEAGFKNWTEMKEIVRGQARTAKTTREWAKSLGMSSKEEQKAFSTMAETGDLEGLARTLQQKASPDELVKKMQELRGKGLAVGDSTIEDMEKGKKEYDAAVSSFGKESDQAREAAERMAKTAAESIAGAEKKKMPTDVKIAAEAEKQTSTQAKILESLDSLRKWLGGTLIGVMFAIKAAIDIGQLLSKSGMKSLTTIGGLFRRMSGLKGAAAGEAAGGLGGAAGGLGLKSIGAVAGKLAGPLAIAAAAAALVGSIKKMSDTYDDAKKKALEGGKSEAEARRIAIAGLKGIGAAKDIIASGLSWVVGDWLGGMIAKALTWIPGFEDVWSDVVDAAMVVADGFSAFWSIAKPILKKGIIVALKNLLWPIRLLWSALKPVVKILFQFGRLLGGIFSGNFGVVKDAIKQMGAALWDGVKDIGWVVWDTFSALPKLVWEGIKGLAGLIWGAFSGLVGLIWDGIKGLTGLIWDGIKGVPSSIASSLGDVGGWLWKKIKSLIPWPFGGGSGGDVEEAAEKTKKATAETVEYQKKYEAGMTAENKARLEAIRQRGAKGGAGPTDPRAKAALDRAKAMKDAALGGAADMKQVALDKAKGMKTAALDKAKGMKTAATAALGGAADMKQAALDKAKAMKDAAAPPDRDMLAAAGRLQAARDGDKAAAGAAGKAVTDNSTWNVHINSRSEKELQDAMLKTLIKHQQRQAN